MGCRCGKSQQQQKEPTSSINPEVNLSGNLSMNNCSTFCVREYKSTTIWIANGFIFRTYVWHSGLTMKSHSDISHWKATFTPCHGRLPLPSARAAGGKVPCRPAAPNLLLIRPTDTFIWILDREWHRISLLKYLSLVSVSKSLPLNQWEGILFSLGICSGCCRS